MHQPTQTKCVYAQWDNCKSVAWGARECVFFLQTRLAATAEKRDLKITVSLVTTYFSEKANISYLITPISEITNTITSSVQKHQYAVQHLFLLKLEMLCW